MIKVQHIISDLNTAGAQTVVMNYLRYFCGSPEVFMVVTVQGQPMDSVYERECHRLGIQVRFLNYHPVKIFPGVDLLINWFRLQWSHYKDIKNVSPDIVHTHVTPILQYTLFPVAFSGVRTRVHTLHSDPFAIRKTSVIFARMAFHHFGFYPICVTEGQAKKAEERYRIKNYSIIRNGIDLERFGFVNKDSIRAQLGIEKNAFVIGCVGRLSRIKNHSFLLRLFSEYVKQKPYSVLLLIGDGEEKEALIAQSKQLGIEKRVVFTGIRNDVEKLYSAMDLFMLTSFSESSSIVTVEAQMAGIRCVVADSIPVNVVITNLVNRISIHAEMSEWIDAMDGKLEHDTIQSSPSDFSVFNSVTHLIELYKKLLES